MPKYFHQQLEGQLGKPNPPLEPLQGQRLAKEERLVSVMKAQDKTVLGCRRIVGTISMRGHDEFQIVHDGTSLSTSATPPFPYPEQNEERVIGRFRWQLTPGCLPRASVLHAPSGPTTSVFIIAEGSETRPGLQGEILFDMTWGVSGNPTSEHRVRLKPQSGQFVSGDEEVINDVDMFDLLRVAKTDFFFPTDVDKPDALQPYSQHITVDCVVSAVGSPRFVDIVLYEQPYAIAFEADDAADQWTSHMYGSREAGETGLGSEYAYQRYDEAASDGDPRGGSWHVTDVARAQEHRYGPVILTWTAHRETNSGDFGSGFSEDDSYVEFSNTTPNDIEAGSNRTAYDDTEDGWTMEFAGYARRYAENHPYAMERNGSVPVLVTAWCTLASGSSGTDGNIRVQSSDESWIDVPVPSTVSTSTATRLRAFGHLRCGAGPGDNSVVQIFVNRGSTQNVRVHQITVQVLEYDETT